MTSVVFLNYYSPYCMQMIPVSCMLSGKDLNDLIAVLNAELISLSVWLKSSKLSLDTHTTFFMVSRDYSRFKIYFGLNTLHILKTKFLKQWIL